MAPSPTGFLHIGGVRTFLFNWLFARGARRRVPAADREHRHEPRGRPRRRSRSSESLRWLGHRLGRPGHLPARRDGAVPASSRERLVASGNAYEDEGAIRFRMPDEGTTGWDDAVRGRIEFPNEKLEDVVIVRSDGRADLQLRLARRGHGRRDHARDPRRRPRLEHAEADPDPRARSAHELPGVRARARHPRRGRQEALEAPRRAVGRRLPRGGLRPRGARQLPRAARLGATTTRRRS